MQGPQPCEGGAGAAAAPEDEEASQHGLGLGVGRLDYAQEKRRSVGGSHAPPPNPELAEGGWGAGLAHCVAG